MRIMITSVGTANSVNLIRYFHKMNHKVFGTDINERGYVAGSILCDEYEIVPLATDNNYLDKIIDLLKKWQIDILIPIHDIEVYVLSQNVDKIHCKCIIPRADVINIFRDKYICNCKMSEIGIPVAEMFFEDRSNIKRIRRDRIGNGSKGIRILNPGDDIEQIDKQKSFIQKYVDGDEYTVDILCDVEGSPVYIVPRRRLEVKAGVATKVKIENSEPLIDLCKRILSKYTLPGFSNIQFIRDKDDNYWFVEVNWRFAGCGGATLAVANDYLSAFIDIAEKNENKQNLNHDVKWNTIVTRYYEEVVYEESVS